MWWGVVCVLGALASAVLALLLYDLRVRTGRVWTLLKRLPGEPTLPLLGNALQLGFTPEDIQKNMFRIWKKNGMRNFRLMLGTEPMLFVCEPDTVKKILGSSTHLSKSDQQLHFFRESFGDSLVQSDGEKWKTMRRLLNPIFLPKLLEEHLKAVNYQGDILVEKLQAFVGQPSFNIYPLVLNYALDVISDSLIGLKLNAQNGGQQEYLQASRKVLPLAAKRFYSPWLRYDFIYKLSPLSRLSASVNKSMREALDRIIDDRRKIIKEKVIPHISNEQDLTEYINNNRTGLTFIDVMLLSKMPDGTPISDESIREETSLMLFAGFDTNLSSMCFALSNLAMHPELQQRVYEEQVSIFGSDDRDPSMQDLNNMKYLVCFIKESMRIYPTVGQFGRKLQADITLDDGTVISKGTNCTIYTDGIYHNPNYFPDPEKFDPDRFLEPMSPYLYMPFSAGPRICIGMNFAWMWMRSTLSKVVRKYEISYAGPQDKPEPVFQIINYSKNGFKLMLKNRK